LVIYSGNKYLFIFTVEQCTLINMIFKGHAFSSQEQNKTITLYCHGKKNQESYTKQRPLRQKVFYGTRL